MPKGKKPIEWISVKEAAAILTANSGHEVTDAYVRRLGTSGRIETWEVDGRTRLYNKEHVETYRVKPRGDGSVRIAVRKDAREKAARKQVEQKPEEAFV